MDLKKYETARDALVGKYHKLREIAEELDDEALKHEADDNCSMLLEDRFKVVVVGEFSRGKSTFINALLGKRILPAKTNPTTTTINRIRYGETPRYLLHFRQQKEAKEISEEQFKSIVAVETNGDDEEAKAAYQAALEKLGNIAYIELHYPLDLTRGGVELIDTPGTNDIDQAREEITLRFIPEADAAIMLLSAEQILARSEMVFLRERIKKNDISKVFFVVNFKDRLDDPAADGGRILRLAREQLKDIVPNPRLFLVSSRGALNWRRAEQGETFKGHVPESFEETGFPELEDALSAYLLQERTRTKLDKYEKRLSRLADTCRKESVSFRRSRLGTAAQELEQELDRLRPRLERARQRSHRVFDNLRSRLQLETESLTGDYQRGLKHISLEVQQAMHRYDGSLDVEEVTHMLEAVTAPLQQEHDTYMNQQVQTCLAKALDDTKKKLKKIFQTEQLSTQRQLAVVNDHANSPTQMELNEVDLSDANFLGGGMLIGGVLFAIHAPFIAIPAAFFGGNYLMRRFEDYRLADFKTKISMQLRSRYDKIIPQQAGGFQRELQQQFHSLSDIIEGMIEQQLQAMEDRLTSVLQEKQTAQRNDDTERQRLDALDRELQQLAYERGR